MHEFTLSYGETFMGGRGNADVSYVFRCTTSLIDDFADLTTGTTDVIMPSVLR
jgi:hypothetical protein